MALPMWRVVEGEVVESEVVAALVVGCLMDLLWEETYAHQQYYKLGSGKGKRLARIEDH